MDIVPYLLNTHDLTTYGPAITDDAYPYAQFSEIERAGTWPLRGGKTFHGKIMVLMLVPPVGTTIGTFRDLIALWCNEETDEEPVFKIKDANNGNKQWYVNYENLGMIEREATTYVKVALHISDPIWKSVDIETNTKAYTASDQTKDIVVGGNRIARPQYNFKTTVARTGGYGYKRYIAIANRTDKLYVDALNLADGNLDHAALVSGGKAQADGDDFRVTYDGAEIFRWAGGGGFNSATLRPICNISLPPQITLTLSGALSNVGSISTITVQNTAANIAALNALALVANKVIAISLKDAAEEIFTFTGTNPAALTITGTTRSQRLSTAKSQVDGAIIRHIPHDIYVMYNNSIVTAPSTNDAFKPMYDLASFTNGSRTWTDYKDPNNPARLGQWVSAILLNVGNKCEIYTANHYTQAIPASEMGMFVKAYKVGTRVKAGNGRLQWTFSHPAGMTNITLSGEKYRKDTGTGWPEKAVLQKSLDGATWVEVADEATPVAANTWAALTVVTGSLSLSGTYYNVGVFFLGAVRAVLNTYAAIEFDSVTVALDTNNTPLISMGAEVGSEWHEFRLTNTTTGQWLEVTIPGVINQNVYVDTKALDAYIVETGERIPVRLDDESRADWLPLDPAQGSGTNTLKVTQSGLNDMTFTETHEMRSG